MKGRRSQPRRVKRLSSSRYIPSVLGWGWCWFEAREWGDRSDRNGGRWRWINSRRISSPSDSSVISLMGFPESAYSLASRLMTISLEDEGARRWSFNGLGGWDSVSWVGIIINIKIFVQLRKSQVEGRSELRWFSRVIVNDHFEDGSRKGFWTASDEGAVEQERKRLYSATVIVIFPRR